jgi:tetratricopeptide (TPR) repeat protein
MNGIGAILASLSADLWVRARNHRWISGFAAAILLGACLAPFAVKRINRSQELRQANQAMENRDYPSAALHFANALELEPNSAEIRLGLARARASSYVAAGDLPDNVALAQLAHTELARLLARAPRDEVMIEAMAALYLKEGKFDEAKASYEKLLSVNSKRKQTYYALGDMVRREFLSIQLSVRAAAGMEPEDAGPIREPRLRAELSSQWLGRIDAAIRHLQKAIDLDSSYEEAMIALGLLLRERADLAEGASQHDVDIQAASRWSQKALEIRAARVDRGAAGL